MCPKHKKGEAISFKDLAIWQLFTQRRKKVSHLEGEKSYEKKQKKKKKTQKVKKKC